MPVAASVGVDLQRDVGVDEHQALDFGASGKQREQRQFGFDALNADDIGPRGPRPVGDGDVVDGDGGAEIGDDAELAADAHVAAAGLAQGGQDVFAHRLGVDQGADQAHRRAGQDGEAEEAREHDAQPRDGR